MNGATDAAAALPIVVGVDGSEPNASAVAWAAAEAAACDAELVLVLAAGEELVPGGPWVAPEVDAASRVVLERVRRDVLRARPQLRVRMEVSVGAAPTVLAEEGRDSALVVLGRRGRGGFARLLIGSTSMATAAHASGPVIVVPPSWDVGGHGERPVVVAVDPAQPEPAALRFAVERARRLGTTLRAVTAWQAPTLAPWNVAGIGDLWDQCEKDAMVRLREVLAPWTVSHPDVGVETVVVHGHPAGAVLDSLGDAELLVVAPRGRGTWGGMRLGSVSRALLQHAALPVAVIHPAAVEPRAEQESLRRDAAPA